MPKFKPEDMIWSYSRANGWANCPYGWWITYFQKNRGENNVFSDYGRLAHEIIQRQMILKLKDKPMMSNETMSNEFRNRYYDIPYKFPSRKMKENYLIKGMEYFESWDSFDGFTVKSVEVMGHFRFAGYDCRGAIDLILEKDGKIYVIDHKTAKEYKGMDLIKYIRQLYFYGPMTAQLLGRFPDYLAFNFVKDKVIRQFEWEDAVFKNTIDWFKGQIDEITACKNFEPRPNPFFCNWLCNHREKCKYRPPYYKSDKYSGYKEFNGYG